MDYMKKTNNDTVFIVIETFDAFATGLKKATLKTICSFIFEKLTEKQQKLLAVIHHQFIINYLSMVAHSAKLVYKGPCI